MKEGKVFEKQVSNSLKKDGIWHMKIRDTYVLDQSMGVGTDINPYDFLAHYDGTLYAFECKSFEGKSISIQLTPDEPKASIKAHQIKGLLDMSQFEDNRAGFLFQLRDFEECYYVSIDKFLSHLAESCKKSINYEEIKKIGFTVPQKKLRTNFQYDLKTIMEM